MRNTLVSACASFSRRLISLALVLVLLHAPGLLAQPAGVTGAQAAAPKELHLVILEGEDALNNIRQRTAREPIVQVEDENHKPVAGALVLFSIHGGGSGAGGSFAGLSSLTTTTGANGQAVATGFTPNGLKGKYTIEVQATLGALNALITIHETNTTKSVNQSDSASSGGIGIMHHFGKKFWLTTAGIGGTVTVITFLALTNNSGANITVGGGTVKP